MSVEELSPSHFRRQFQVKAFARALISHDFDMVAAAREALVSQSNNDAKVKTKAMKLFRTVELQNELARVVEDRLEAAEVTVDKTLSELAAIAYRDPKAYMDAEGEITGMHALSPKLRRSISEITRKPDGTVTYKLESKMAALAMLTKYQGMAKEQVVHDVEENSELAELFSIVRKANSDKSSPI